MSADYNEEAYENALIELFLNMGWEHVYGQEVDRDWHSPPYDSVLEDSIRRLNPKTAPAAIDEAFLKLRHFENEKSWYNACVVRAKMLRQKMLRAAEKSRGCFAAVLSACGSCFWGKYLFILLVFLFVLQGALSQESDQSGAAENHEKISGTEKPLVGKTIFSVDLGYLGTGLKNNGWGFGLTLEIQLLDFFSIRPGFSHMTMWPSGKDLVITTVGIRSDLLFYPFNRGLDRLYLGGILRTEFVMYAGDDRPEARNQETVISIAPVIGWKQNFADFVMVDFFVSYQFIQNEEDLSAQVVELYDKRFEYGVKFKLNIGKIASFLVTHLSSKK